MKVTDPVCGRSLDAASAATQMTNGRVDLYFCSEKCRTAFESGPSRYVAIDPNDPPFTVSEHFAAPKFGSAGSGGLEFEPGPKREG
jgi:YHS domain-containing protein